MRDEFVLMVGLEDGNLRNIFPDGDYMREHLYRKHQELGIL